jgi:hypothetical protein
MFEMTKPNRIYRPEIGSNIGVHGKERWQNP